MRQLRARGLLLVVLALLSVRPCAALAADNAIDLVCTSSGSANTTLRIDANRKFVVWQIQTTPLKIVDETSDRIVALGLDPNALVRILLLNKLTGTLKWAAVSEDDKPPTHMFWRCQQPVIPK